MTLILVELTPELNKKISIYKIHKEHKTKAETIVWLLEEATKQK